MPMPTYPPFAYNMYPDNKTTFSMSPGNAAPAILTWLFLLTETKFLPQLKEAALAGDPAKVVFQDTTGNKMDINGLSQITNLTPACLVDLFNMYLSPDETDEDRDNYQSAFATVAQRFQDFAIANTNLWLECECPGITGLKQLAASGAIVDPAAYQRPSRKLANIVAELLKKKPSRKVANIAAELLKSLQEEEE